MNERTVEKALSRLGVEIDIPEGEDKIQISCPLAAWTHERGKDNHPSMRLDISENPPSFICFACKHHGNLAHLIGLYNKFSGKSIDSSEFISPYQGLRPREKKKEIPKGPMYLPESLLENFLPYAECDLAVRYLKKRKISLDVADHFGLLYDPERGAVVFPIRSPDGRFLGAVGRYTENKDKRYHNYFHAKLAATLGGYNLLKNPTRIFVVEGFMDLLSAHPWVQEIDGGVVCTWTSRMSAGQAALLMSYDATIYCAYDADKAGEEGWKTIKSYFGSISGNRIRRLVLPQGFDINDLSKGEFFTFYEESRKGRLL